MWAIKELMSLKAFQSSHGMSNTQLSPKQTKEVYNWYIYMISAQKPCSCCSLIKHCYPCGVPSLVFLTCPPHFFRLHSFVCFHMSVSHSAGLKASSISNKVSHPATVWLSSAVVPEKLVAAEMKWSTNGSLYCEGGQGQITNLIYVCGLPRCRCA